MNNAGTAVRRSSNTSADLPTDASGFTARWLSREGERWFASSLWYFHRWQEQHTQYWGNIIHTDTGDASVIQLWYKFKKSTCRRMKPRETVCPFDLLMCFSQVKTEETALAAVHGCLQGDCSLILQTGTMWYYNNKDTLSESETLLSSLPEAQRTSTMQSVWENCHCHCGLELLSDQVHFHSQMDRNVCCDLEAQTV